MSVVPSGNQERSGSRGKRGKSARSKTKTIIVERGWKRGRVNRRVFIGLKGDGNGRPIEGRVPGEGESRDRENET